MEQTIYVTTPFPPQLEYQARMEAAKQRISRAELVRLAVIDYLKRLEAQPAPTKAEASRESGCN
jgi:hypothetical protein